METEERVEQLVAKKIREARRRRRLTLVQLSDQTKISTPMLSKIENAKVSSPISVYAKIAKALGIPLGELFSIDGPVPISFVKKNERKEYTRTKSYIAESIGFKKSHKKMEPFILTYPPEGMKPTPNQHDNEELLFVIEGELEFRYGKTKYLLSPGDCLYFDANVKHCARALGARTAQVLIVEA